MVQSITSFNCVLFKFIIYNLILSVNMNETIIIYDFCFTPSLPIFPDAQKFTKSTILQITSTMDTTLEAVVWAIITVSMLVARITFWFLYSSALMALTRLHSCRLPMFPLGSLYFTGFAFAYRYLCSVTGSYKSPHQKLRFSAIYILTNNTF